RQPLMPLISAPGNGGIIGQGFKWRWRWKNSKTGDCSGLSPSPTFKYDLGVPVSAGAEDWFGQTAYLRIPTATAATNADSIELFRNTTNQEDIWFSLGEKLINGASYVDFTDGYTDEELVALGLGT